MATILKPSPPVEREPELAPFPVYRFTAEQYHRMADAGVLTEDDHVELLEGWIVPKDGWIVPKMVKNPPHDGVIGLVEAVLRSRLRAGWIVRGQSAITTADSEPGPDVAVVHGEPRTFVSRHPEPSEIGLVIEVADSSLKHDRKKSRMYARAGIPHYWIINLVDAQIETYNDPTGPAATPVYRQHTDYRDQDAVPLVIEGQQIAEIRASELLP
jgi:Uma2 family endonuclease